MSDLYAKSAKTLNEQQIQALVDEFEALIVDRSNRRRMLLTTEWKNGFPITAGVYAVFDSNDIVYAGETGSIRGRMNDLRHTQHHTLRRNAGARQFCDVPGYEKASSHKKYAPHIEQMVVEYLCRLEVTALPVAFGRKELEEHLIVKFNPIYNRKSKRGGS